MCSKFESSNVRKNLDDKEDSFAVFVRANAELLIGFLQDTLLALRCGLHDLVVNTTD